MDKHFEEISTTTTVEHSSNEGLLVDVGLGQENTRGTSRLRSELFENKIMLAPMVRINGLPFRLMALNYGADLVYSEELIDYRLAESHRVVNKHLGTIDFVDVENEVIFRTCSRERDHLILQIGSNDPERALKAVRLVADDVMAIDFNFGCPKSFSLKGGMGAALLTQPDKIRALLTTVINSIDLPVTCKIRVLPNLKDTLNLVRLIESCGVSAIGVHGRTKLERPRHKNRNDFITAIVNEINIPVIASGGSSEIKSFQDILNFRCETKASSVMVARAALKNCSIFKRDNKLLDMDTLIKDYLKLAIDYDNFFSNTKFTIQNFLAYNSMVDNERGTAFLAATDMKTICSLFEIKNYFDSKQSSTGKRQYEKESDQVTIDDIIEKRIKLDDQSNLPDLISDSISYDRNLFNNPYDVPKAKLMRFAQQMHVPNPTFEIIQLSNHYFYSIVTFDQKQYLNKAWAKNKKNAEHASAMIACKQHNLIDIESYKSRLDHGHKKRLVD